MKRNIVYENFLRERQIQLEKVKNKDKLEASIRTQLRKNMLRNKGGYFKVEDLLQIEEVQKHFQFFAITGDRNIGKTTALKNFLKDKYENENSEFIWLRNLQTEIDSLLPQIKQDWFDEYGWEYLIKTGTVFETKKDLVAKNSKKIIGHFKALSNSANLKSVEFKRVNYVVYDEFNNTNTIKEKYKKLITLLTTIERQKNNFKVLLTANYIDQSDDILQSLGLFQSKQNKQPLLVFNWISRSIIWNIPKGYYAKGIISKTLSYALSLNNFDVYQTQYAGTFKNKYKTNIFPIEKLTKKKILIYLAFQDFIFSVFYNDDKIVICNDEKFVNDITKKLYAINENTKMRHYESIILPPNVFKFLKSKWEKNQLFADNQAIAELLITYFSGRNPNEDKVRIIKET